MVDPGTPPPPKVTHRLERLEVPPRANVRDKGSSPDLGFHVTSRCPSCRHQTTDLFVVSMVSSRGGIARRIVGGAVGRLARSAGGLGGLAWAVDPVAVPWRGPEPSVGPTVGLVRCRCAGLHPRGDEPVTDTLGCGSRWLLRYDPRSDDLDAVPTTEQSVYWSGAELVGSGAPAAAAVVRGVATAWQGGITALLALGAVGATLSRDAVQSLAPASRWGVGVLAALSFALTAVALFQASVAASGIPRVGAASVDDVASADLAPLRQAVQAGRALALALGAALVAIVLGAATVAVLVFSPASDEGSLVRVTWKEGSSTTSECGTLTLQDGSAILRPEVEGSPVPGFPQASIVSVTAC